MSWYIVVGGVFLGLLLLPLRSRWYMGCALALLGTILGGAGAFGAGWYYLKYQYVPPRPRNDSDFGGFETPLLCLFVLPAFGAIGGLLLGVVCSYWLRLWSSDEDDL